MQTRNRGQLIFGGILVLLGVLFLISTVFRIDFGVICWPVFLIGLGVWLLVRPKLRHDGAPVTLKLIGDVRRRGFWPVLSEEFWIGVGDVDLDFSQAELPSGEAVFRIYTLIGDVHLYLPPDAGLNVHAMAFIGDARILGYRETGILAPVDFTSPGYDTAERRIRIEVFGFIGDVKADRFTPPSPGTPENIHI
ncbi:MAG TPA: cell wall-active antibiotics response protein LiaF [Anaerolineaceae bacterium]|jgi:hypothetical protein|nr:cell wall-active antibiotics response protein LiaF [Anaerolineaceae bacterium]